MRNFALLFVVIICFSGCKKEVNPETIVWETIEKYKNHQSISYDISYKMKFFDGDEFYEVTTRVEMIRRENDTVFRSSFLYNRKDTLMNVSKYYDTELLYVINHNEGKVTRYNEVYPITGAMDGSVIDTYFHNINGFEKRLKREDLQIQYKDTLNFVKINIKFPDEEDYYGKEENIFINKSSKTIEKITFQAQYKDQIQKNEWILSAIHFDQVKEQDLENSVQEYFENYPTEDYKPLTEEDYKLLENGTIAPEIKGKIYPDYQEEITLKSDKILVLDFWYTSCMPCIKAIPHLNKLQENYKEHIEIIGVNPFEGEEKKKDKIEAFLNREPVDYPILFTESTVPNDYKVRAYPTLYIIGKDGKVKFSKVGSSDDLYEELETALKEIMK